MIPALVMLFLLFQVGEERYAIESRRVVEVLPLLTLQRWPQAPKGLSGLFNYRGQSVPAVDLSELVLGHPAAERLSTRIILTTCTDTEGVRHLVGLIAEHATELLRREAGDFERRLQQHE